jgi:hypothetical protein
MAEVTDPELRAAIDRLARSVARRDTAEGGHRQATTTARLLAAAARVRAEGTLAQERRAREMVAGWREMRPPPTTLRMAEELEALLAPGDGGRDGQAPPRG